MPVVKLRTPRDRERSDRLRAARAFLSNIAGDDQLLGRVIGQIDRELAPGGGWRFVMTEPDLNTFVVDSLALTSKRPIKAMRLWAHLIPSALAVDCFGPLAPGDGGEPVGHRDEGVPGLAAGLDDGVVVGPDA